ncbi:helix-turn-helix domain-containing protein [Brevibacillus sp. NPDC058079]|uniref:helix-turn-helix domain-containing protein n=1 Tax=Brevibacillus sp. NPDC058079 TaxID=3346330 RepID=UPI0036E82ED1
MAFTYKPLLILMINKGIKKGELRDLFSGATVAKFEKDEPVSLDVLDTLCNYLDCRIEDIIEHKPDKRKEKSAPN